MLDDQHRGAQFATDLLDEWPEGLGFALGDTSGGLIEAEELGVDGEQAGQFDDATGPGGQIADEAVGVAAETEEGDEFVGLGSLGPFDAPVEEEGAADERRPSPGLERNLDGLAHGELGEQGGGLEGSPEPGSGPCGRRGGTDVVTEQFDAAGRGHETADGVHERRLAGTVGADEPDDFVATDVDRDVVDRREAAELHLHIRGAQHDIGDRAHVTVDDPGRG